MSAPQPAAPVVPPSGEGWTVVVNMPCWESGKKKGQPVGWLNMNEGRHKMTAWRMSKAWRKAAFDALTIARLPRGLPRVRIQFELRFTTKQTARNAANYELTIKPVEDAAGPKKVKIRRDPRTGGKKPVVEWGVGLVAGDDKRYIDRPEVIIGPPLGRDHKSKGQVILHITPLPGGTP